MINVLMEGLRRLVLWLLTCSDESVLRCCLTGWRWRCADRACAEQSSVVVDHRSSGWRVLQHWAAVNTVEPVQLSHRWN